MATAITTTATTLEGQAWEVLHALENMQVDPNTNPDGVTIILSKTLNSLTDTATMNLSFRVIEAAGATGSITVTAEEVFDLA